MTTAGRQKREQLLALPARKELRAQVVCGWAAAAGYPGVVAFSCGNAAQELAAAAPRYGLTVLGVYPDGPLVAGRWWRADEIRAAWPHLLDATSGHLPLPLMHELALAWRGALGDGLDACPDYLVPSGSGETVLALRWAYPEHRFVAWYEWHSERGCRYEPEAPLNDLVRASGPVRWYGVET